MLGCLSSLAVRVEAGPKVAVNIPQRPSKTAETGANAIVADFALSAQLNKAVTVSG